MANERMASGMRSKVAFVLEVLTVASGGVMITAHLATAAPTETVCVACVEPDRRYRCEVTTDKSADKGRLDARSLSFLCAAKIAHESSHSSCAALSSAKDCDGVVKAYSSADLAPPAEANAPASADSEADANGEEPATVAEMTKGTLDKSRENMRKAGEAVDNTAKRALRCLGLSGGDC
jgi:hypothetical protein